VHSRESDSSASANGSAGGSIDMTKKPEKADPDERPPYDADAT
jgi:sec-independent protein translocase protein TatB